MTQTPGSLRPLALLCALGVALRLLFLWAAGDTEFQADEANYVYLALHWRHFGFFPDSFRFLWPPGYPWLLSLCLSWFEMGGLFVMKLVQVLASASTGLSIMLLARRLGRAGAGDEERGLRAAKIAGLAWVFYLPLASFTHYLWAESMFLALFAPAMLLVWGAIEDGAEVRDRRLIAAGLLFTAAAYIKEAPLYLGPVIVALLTLVGHVPFRERLRRGLLFGLTCAAAMLPWTLHNWEVYGRVVPLASSLGENVYGGLNAPYKNFDITAYGRMLGATEDPLDETRKGFVEADPAPAWRRAEEIKNTPDRFAENVSRGLEYAGEHPEWLVRSRVMKLADLVAPHSFFVRHQVLGHYEEHGPSLLGKPVIREGLILWAFLCPLLLLPLGLVGLWVATPRTRAAWFGWAWLGYFVGTGLLVAMSRFRIPFLPLLLAAAAALLAGHFRELKRPLVLLPSLLSLALLFFLWWVNLPEVWTVLRMAL